MDITIYKDFCIHISSETPENKHIINMVLNLPDDLGIRILNEFSTRVLCQKIHPIQEDDIRMASTIEYRQFIRNNSNTIGKFMNRSRLRTLLHIYIFMENTGSMIRLKELITSNYQFYPSRSFLRIHQMNLKKEFHVKFIIKIYQNKFDHSYFSFFHVILYNIFLDFLI